MKLEHLFILTNKLFIFFIEFKNFLLFFIGNLKTRYFFLWKTSSFADYYWFLYSNKHFTFLNKYL